LGLTVGYCTVFGVWHSAWHIVGML
jgi:hypothetical protein